MSKKSKEGMNFNPEADGEIRQQFEKMFTDHSGESPDADVEEESSGMHILEASDEVSLGKLIGDKEHPFEHPEGKEVLLN